MGLRPPKEELAMNRFPPVMLKGAYEALTRPNKTLSDDERKMMGKIWTSGFEIASSGAMGTEMKKALKDYYKDNKTIQKL
jgi:hypothetical protein